MRFLRSYGAVVVFLFGAALSPAFCQKSDSVSIDDARNLVVHERFKEAEAVLHQSIATRPSDPQAHFLLAYVLLREDLPKQSLAEYTQAARLRTPSVEDLRNVALDYVLLNDYPEAEKWTLRSLEMDGNDPESWYSLGRIRYSTGKFQDAVDCFQHTLRLAPRSVKAETNLGLAYEALNQLEPARQSYQTAVDMQKDEPNKSAQPLINLATLLLHRSDLDEALVLLKQAVEIAPNDVRAREQMGHVYLEQDHLVDAQLQFERAVALSPQDPRLHFLLGRVYRREGMTQKAEVEFARTASLNGTHSTPEK
jgi:Flp pilus assembly protein TadD